MGIRNNFNDPALSYITGVLQNFNKNYLKYF